MLTADELAHARSILDANPTLEPLPHMKEPRILIASVIRKPPVVVEALLKTLTWQRLKKPAQIDYLFVPNFAEGDAFQAASLALLKDSGHPVVSNVSNPGNDYGEGPTSRQWSPQAWHRVGAMKDRIIAKARDEGYDYLWLVDADVFCDPYTLQSLLDADAQIVSAVYWTHWQKPNPDAQVHQHAGPQVWLRHPYVLDGRGYTEAEFRAMLTDRQLMEVWGLGACTLIAKAALEKGVSFSKVGELPPGPMSDGEDRHFCHRATALHLSLMADAWPDVYHAYHPEDYDEIPKRMEQLEAAHKEQPGLGDLVSVRINPLEPVPTRQGLIVPNTQWVRGRYGLLPVAPELEEALGSMTVGERRLVEVHFPVYYELAQLRGQRRVFQVDLLDCKPFAIAPVLSEEIMVGGNSGAVIDPTGYTAEQIDSLLEAAHAK
jgi:hypothetical protein